MTTPILNVNEQVQQRRVTVDAYAIIDSFFEKMTDSMVFRMFMKMYSAEEAEKEFQSIFDMNMQVFEASMKQLQMSNLADYLELKKIIQQSFDNLKNQIKTAYIKKTEETNTDGAA